MILSLTFIILISFFGAGITYLLDKGLNYFERISIGFGLGTFLITFVGYLFLFLGYSFTLISAVVAITLLIILSLAGYLGVYKKSSFTFKLLLHNAIAGISMRRAHLVLVILVFTFIFFLIYEASYWPISSWDALTLYDLRGKFMAEGMTLSNLAILDGYDKFNLGYYFSYPMYTSLIHSYYYLLKLPAPQVFYPFLLIMFGLFFYSSIKKYISLGTSIFFTLIFLFSPSITKLAIIPYANIPHLFYYFMSTILLAKWISSTHKKTGLLVLSSILLSASLWVRIVEPFYLVNILLLLGFILIKYKKRLYLIPVYILPVFLVRWLWTQGVKNYSESIFTTGFSLEMLNSKIFNLEIIKSGLEAILNFLHKNILVITIFILAQIDDFKAKRLFSKTVTLIFILDILMLFAGTILIGLLLGNRYTEILNSIGRTGIFIYPFALYIIALDFPRYDTKVRNK